MQWVLKNPSQKNLVLNITSVFKTTTCGVGSAAEILVKDELTCIMQLKGLYFIKDKPVTPYHFIWGSHMNMEQLCLERVDHFVQ